MALFRDEAPILSPNAVVDEGLGANSVSKVVGSWVETSTPATSISAATFQYIAPYPLEIVAIYETHSTASSSGTVTVEKLTGTTAPGSGTAVLASAISTASTANTVQTGTLASSVATLQLAKGDRLAFVGGGTQTSLAGCVVAIQLKRI